MINPLVKFREFLIPEEIYRSPEQLRRAITISDFTFTSFVSAIPAATYYYLAGYMIGVWVTLGFLLTVLSLIILHSVIKIKGPHFFTHAMGATNIAAITLLAIWSGGIYSPVIIFYVTVIPTIYYVSGKKIGVFWSVILVVTLAALALTHIFIHPFPNLFERQAAFYFNLAIVANALIIFISSGYQWEVEREILKSDIGKQRYQLVQQEKMASLGQLTAGIAHEINNPINYISNNAEALKLDLNDLTRLFDLLQQSDDLTSEEFKERALSISSEIGISLLKQEMEDMINGMHRGTERVSEIVRSLNYFSHPGLSDKVPADIPDLIDTTLVILKHDLQGRADVKKSYEKTKPVMVHPNQLIQVFLNIIKNSIESMTAIGTILIHVKEGDDHVIIEIEDNGKGMPEEIIEKLFEPFYTTKSIGEGTGLGLSISYGIVQAHGGKIDVESEYGKGSKFIIALPLR